MLMRYGRLVRRIVQATSATIMTCLRGPTPLPANRRPHLDFPFLHRVQGTPSVALPSVPQFILPSERELHCGCSRSLFHGWIESTQSAWPVKRLYPHLVHPLRCQKHLRGLRIIAIDLTESLVPGSIISRLFSANYFAFLIASLLLVAQTQCLQDLRASRCTS